MSLASATRSEFTKYFTTASWWILGLVTVASLVVFGGGFAAVIGLAKSGAIGDSPDAAMLAAGGPTLVYGLTTNLGYIFPLLLGVLLVTSEFRHNTLAPSFLATPRRGSVLSAKLIAGAVLGAALGVIALISTVGAGVVAFLATGHETDLFTSDHFAMFARIVLSFVLWTLVGVGVGVTVRNQIAAIVIVLAVTQLVEPLVRFAALFAPALKSFAAYLPSAASDALVGSNYYAMIGVPSEPMHWYLGAAVLVVYAIVLTALGAIISWRRDVD